jgi:hypothetical protein
MDFTALSWLDPYQAEQALLALVSDRVAAAAAKRVQALIAVSDDEHDDGEDVLAVIKAPSGNVDPRALLATPLRLAARAWRSPEITARVGARRSRWRPRWLHCRLPGGPDGA